MVYGMVGYVVPRTDAGWGMHDHTRDTEVQYDMYGDVKKSSCTSIVFGSQ
jgi:hypothetical protein